MTTSKASQVTAYSFQPFIELTPDESSRLSAMTRNARNVIYVKGFLANTKMNKNNFRITDNKYIEQNRGIAAGRSINFGPKMLGKAHHPNFYHDLDLTGKTPDEARKMFLEYQEWSRIGDILRIDYEKATDQWKFYGAISHPNIVEAVQKGELELPKYVSPYFWNLNDPEDTGPEIREAELFHVSFVDDPAYGVEVAKIDGYCDSSEGGKACVSQLYGMPAGMATDKVPTCACGLMASYENKLVGSSFYVERPTLQRTNTMSDPNNPNNKPENGPNEDRQDGGESSNKSPDQQAKDAALKKMQEYDKMANEGKANIKGESTKEETKTEEETETKEETVEEKETKLQQLLDEERAKADRAAEKKYKKQTDELKSTIAKLEKEIAARDAVEQEVILNKYIKRENYKDKAQFEERLTFYKNLAKEYKMTNDKLEELMKDHYQIKEIANKNGAAAAAAEGKGKGAGTVNPKNMDPFGFEEDSFGLLSNNSSNKRGIGASVNPDDEVDSDETEDEVDSNGTPPNAAADAILKAF